jgi:LysR family hca operon transcriptional activator
VNLRDQRYMTALSTEGSLVSASRKLGISQPALSRWLHGLEQSLGTTLVLRSPKQLVLTESGQIYADGCRQCLALYEEMNQKLQEQKYPSMKQRKIILGGSVVRGSKAFAYLYVDFKKRYPDINLDIVLDTNIMLHKLLLDGKISIAMLGATATSMDDLEYMKFMDEELLLFVPPGHKLSYDMDGRDPGNYPTIDLYKLQDTPFMVQEKETSYSELLYKLLDRNGLTPNIIFRSNMLPLLYDMVCSGAGAAILPEAYYRPEDHVSVYRIQPRIIVYQGIGVRKGYPLSEPEEYVIHRIMDSWGSPYYMHRYAEYYLEQRRANMIGIAEKPQETGGRKIN